MMVKYWYISIGIEVEAPTVELTDEAVGIDLGIKDLAVCSNEMKFEIINKVYSRAKTSTKNHSRFSLVEHSIAALRSNSRVKTERKAHFFRSLV